MEGPALELTRTWACYDRLVWRLAGCVLLLGCGPSPAPDAGSADGAPDGRRCLDDARYEVCEGGACTASSCRGDELCRDAACVPWTEADLFCDFELEYSGAIDRRVRVRVVAGGFPRSQVQALRFDFGDGVAGWGEDLRHDYAEPGAYVVSLEVRLTGHRVLRANRLARIDPPAGRDPSSLTVNAIPELLNGSVPFERGGLLEAFTLSVPTDGFSVDITLLEDPADPVLSLSLTADVPVGVRPAGAELIDGVIFEEGPRLRVRRGSWILAESDAVPEGPLTLMLTTETESARHERSLSLRARIAPRPFDRPQVWLFRTDSDFFTSRVDGPGPRFGLVSDEVPNGTWDLEEELALLGAQGPDAVLNERYLDWIKEMIREEVYRTYGVAPDGTPRDAIPLTIVWQGEPGAPDPADFDPAGDISLMRFGGTFAGFVGYSGISAWNIERTDDSTVDRGVATASLLGILTSTAVVSAALDPLKPGVGAPVGTHPLDAAALDPTFDRFALDADPEIAARHETLREIARYLALAIASVTAHEMGHAMGLMPNGVPPLGYFGDEGEVSFVSASRTNRWHADLPGLNLMQAGGDYLGVIDEALMSLELPRTVDLIVLARILALENRLSPYARAYLQGRLTYDSADGMEAGLRVGCRR